MTELYPFQHDGIVKVEDRIAAGVRRLLVVAPTGSGKTVVGSAIIKRHIRDLRSGVLVLAHRREIISQTSNKLHGHGVAHGIIQAGTRPRPLEKVQVASVQTLHIRSRYGNMDLPPATMLVIDECHHAPASSYKKIIDAYPDAILIGLTATPCRGDGRGLGGIFEEIIEFPQIPELIEGKYLVGSRVYAPATPNLKGVKVQAGDYVESQLADRMDQPELIGDIVSHWLKFGERRKAVAFAVNVQHSIHLRDEFVSCGVRAEHIDGSTPKPERDAILARLASGETELVSNCQVLTEGFDCPDIGCIVLARPTRKMGLYRQMVGRGLRTAPDKADAIILDHSGAVFRHGFPEDRVEWTLDVDTRAESAKHQSRLEYGSSSRLIECTQCTAIREAGCPCPNCGFMPVRPPKEVVTGAGSLGLVDRNGNVHTDLNSPSVRAEWHSMLTHIAKSRDYKDGWIAHQYKNKFGAWPPSRFVAAPKEPSREVLQWVRSRQIAYAKAGNAAA